MSIKTLLIDDERSSLEESEIFLESINDEIKVFTVSSAEEALDLLDEKDFDVIVSDYQMPEMDGLDLLEKLREERDSDIPFIMFTGKGREEVAIKALNLGADRYIQKGGDPESQYEVLVDAIIQEFKRWDSKRRLEESEKEKSRILEITSDEIAYHDTEHRIIWANRSYLESVGKSLEEIKGKKCYNVWYGRDEHCEGCPTEKAMKSGEREKEEISPSETDRHWLITANPDIDEEGDIIGVIESSLDITERKKIQDELEKSKHRYEALFEENPEALVETDEDFKILRINAKFETLFGFEEDEIKGKYLNKLIVPEDKLEEAEKLNEKSKDEGYLDHETVRLTKEGKEIAVAITCRPVEENEKTHYLAVYRDISERKKTEEELKEREERFQTLKSSIPAVIYICRNDERWTMESINEAVKEITGYPKEKFLKDEISFTELYHPDDRKDIFEKVEKAIENRSTFHLEYRINDSEGNIRWLEEFGKAIYENGNATRLVGSVHDITEKKEMEKELRKNKERLDLALKSAELGIWDWNVKTDEVDFNERWAEMIGYEIDEIEPTLDSWEERVHPDDLSKVKKELEKHLKGETDLYKTEHRIKTKSGDWLWIKDVGKVVERDENDEPVRAIGIHEDITDRKKSDHKLKEREEKYRTIFESANDAIFIMKEDRFVDCNEKTLEIFECDREDIVGAPPYKFSPEKQPGGRDSREMALEKINSALEGEPQEFEWVHTTKNGEPFHAEVTLNRYMINGQKFVMAIVRDITDRKEAKEQIEENKNKIERLHEISAELQSYDSEDDVYSFAVQAAEYILDFDICGFDAVEGDKFVVKKTSSETPKGGSTERRIEEGGLDKKTYLDQESYLVNDLSANKDAKPVKNEYRSAISVPVGEKGIFQAVSKKTGHFDEEDLGMAELLTGHVSEALNRIQVKKREDFLHSLLRHDVGNKAHIAKGYLDLMERSDSPKEVGEYREKAKKSIIAAQRMVDKVRKLRKIDEEEEIGERNLSMVIDKVLSEHSGEINEREINTDVKVSDTEVKGGALLEDLFSNLIENSIQHSRCGMIRIDSDIKEDKCIVIVEDDGRGISDEDKDKIFDKGYKKGETAGSGLGLYMVKEIAKSYDGSVEVKDSDLGGVSFEVRLKRV